MSDKSPVNDASNYSFADQIKKLSEGLEIVSAELQLQVRQKHSALLSQASHAGKLSAALNSVSGHMERLQACADRLQTQVNVPFVLVENQTRVLDRLHKASHLLRQAGRVLQLYRNFNATKDLSAQADVLNELEPLIEDPELNRIQFIRDEIAVIVTARQRINILANRELLTGLKECNETQVANSLQVFIFNFN